MSENVKIYLRIKPQEVPKEFEILGNTIRIDNNELTFDRIFNQSTQQEVFQELSKSLLVECMQGYNCTLFAYGQTGSGKTYTIQGSAQSTGLVQRSLNFLHNNTDLKISLSFVEIYNETMQDLFDVNASLSIREDPLDGVVVDNLTTLTSSSYEESMELYSKGIRVRKTSSTSMNRDSSRSHSIFTIKLESSNHVMSKSSRLCFVDLAGSERLRDNEIEETKFRETTNINKSLLCLGKVINKLSSGEDGHISYRESKLTFLLRDSLGGNCKLVVVGNVFLEHRSDSMNTINFLRRSKMIKNFAVANYDVSGELHDVKEKLKALDKENQSLKANLALAGSVFQEERSAPPSFQHEIKQVIELVSDITVGLNGLGETVRRIADSDIDKNRRLLLSLNDHFLTICQERKESIESVIKRKQQNDDGN